MIKVTLITNAGRQYAMVAEDATPRQVLDENNVNYGVGKVTIDSIPVTMGDMDKSFAELGVKDTCYLTCVVKADNAAKAVVAGNACVITSAAKLEDLKLIKKYRPEALTLYKGEGKNKEPIFGVALSKLSAGSLNANGAVFGPTASAEGYATITILIDPDEKDVAGMLEDSIGAGLLKLEKFEAQVPEILEEIQAEQATVREHISIL